MIKLYIANLGKYNEGMLKGGYISLPFTDEEFQEFLTETVGINEEYEEYAIHDYESKIEQLNIGEYENISKLNELIEEIHFQNMDIDLINAILLDGYFGTGTGALEDIVNSIDDFSLVTDVKSELDVGYYVVEELLEKTIEDVGETIWYNIDHEGIGRDYLINSSGSLTRYGLLEVHN